MPIETPTQTVPNLGELKEYYKQKLDKILYKELTPDNIDRFADDALEGLVALTDDALNQYKNNIALKANLELGKQQQEDDAFTKLDLPNIKEILQRVIEVREKIENLKNYIGQKTETTDAVITPPQQDYEREILGGTGQGIEDKALVPRLLTLLYLLDTDLEVAKEAIKITEGTVTPQMMRKTPYVRVEIPDLKRVAYLCDEEGNASYVFDTQKLEQAGLKIEEIDLDDKRNKNSLIAMYPGVGARIMYTKYWRENMSSVLSDLIPEKTTAIADMIEEQERLKKREIVSEFERPPLLSFEKFQEEIRDLYPGTGDVQKWYKEEKNNHKDWSSVPYKVFRNHGWIGWAELVGKESHLKREFLNFEELQAEVRTAYPGKGHVSDWYMQERKKHKGWPSDPHLRYKDSGWEGWSEFVGLENPLKKAFVSFADFQAQLKSLYAGQGNVLLWFRGERTKHLDWPSNPEAFYDKEWQGWPAIFERKKEFLPFNSFCAEVKAVYPGEGDVFRWYQTEKMKHSNWPSNPNQHYENDGWIGWPELVGKANFLDKEYLPFDKFHEEVNALYPGKGDVKKWYSEEISRHPNWHFNPYKYYKDQWKGWSELVGKENHLKKDFLPFLDFQTEIKRLYPGKGGIEKWYRVEKKNHNNWPSQPDRVYKDKGWVSWPGLKVKED